MCHLLSNKPVDRLLNINCKLVYHIKFQYLFNNNNEQDLYRPLVLIFKYCIQLRTSTIFEYLFNNFTCMFILLHLFMFI